MRYRITRCLLLGILLVAGAASMSPARATGDDASAPPPDLAAVIDALDQADPDDVLNDLEDLSDNGNAYAPEVLGAMYYYGVSVTKRPCRAFEFYRLAAERDNPRTNSLVADFYANGECVPRDFDLAEEFYDAGLAKGDVGARLGLAFLYLEDEWPERDEQRAFRLIREGYEQASTVRARARVATSLGIFYRFGYGVARDLERMEALMREAAELGNRHAQLFLAWAIQVQPAHSLRHEEIVMWLILADRQAFDDSDEPPDEIAAVIDDEPDAAAIRARAEEAARAKFEEIAADPESLVAEAAAWCTKHRPGLDACRWYAFNHDLQCTVNLGDEFRRWGIERTGFYDWCRAEALAEDEPHFEQ